MDAIKNKFNQFLNFEQLKYDIQQHKKTNADDTSVSLICLDIASLKRINDVYGWEIGDRLILAIGSWITDLNIPNANLYRISGDEFCLATETNDKGYVKKLADRIFNRFNKAWVFKSDRECIHVFCNVFMGVIFGDEIRKDISLLSLIERALVFSRKNKNLIIYNEAADREYEERMQLEISLETCVKNGMIGFDVYYQPIVSSVDGSWCGVEALCRWTSPHLGPVPPNIFIPAAERQCLILPLGEWVLETAVSTCKRMNLDKLKDFILDVNLSALQFLDSQLSRKIINVLKKYDYPGEKLCLEITESAEFNFDNQSMEAVNRLAAKNILISVDDFGTGYSSFQHLKALPLNILKTEPAFIRGIHENGYLQYLFYIMTELAHSANLTLIAEGVETPEQMNLLVQSGADYLQGYLFAKPMSAKRLESRIDNFYNRNEAFLSMQKGKIFFQKLMNVDGLHKPVSYMHQVLNRCMQVLFFSPAINEAIEQVLSIVGTEIKVSRSYIFNRDEDGLYSDIYEWCAKDIAPQKEALQRLDLSEEWIPALQKGGIILANDIAQLPPKIFESLNSQNIKALLVIPLWDKDEVAGFVGFDDCAHYRNWRFEEILMLRHLCMLIMDTQLKHTWSQEILTKNKLLEDILNNIDISIHVSGLETGETLFANRMYYDKSKKKHSKICNRIIEWNDKKAQLTYTIDTQPLSKD